MEAVVWPFSFREALRHAGLEPDKPVHRLTKAERSQTERQLLEYLRCGGFPEAQGQDERNRLELLRTYVDVVLLRDIIERHNVTQPQVLRWMVRQLLGNAASSFSINKFHADLKSRGVAVAKDTLHELLGHIEDAFLLCSIEIAADSQRRRQVNPRKVYPVDTGLCALFERSDRLNIGHALETVVLHELQRRGATVAYVKTPAGFEVDFLARTMTGDEMLIQVCASLDDPVTLRREVRALEDALLEFREAQADLIALDVPPRVEVPPSVRLVSAYEWLLDAD